MDGTELSCKRTVVLLVSVGQIMLCKHTSLQETIINANLKRETK